MKTTCSKCSQFGLEFSSEHIVPVEYIEGNPNADIWIVGLNPKADIGHVEKRTKENFKDFTPDCHPYFSDFKKVSPKLYANWISENSNVAHTDLVKCFSHNFPPPISQVVTTTRNAHRKIINNCKVHLIAQLNKSRPKLIICNGSAVCWEMIELFPPAEENDLKSISCYKAKTKFGEETQEFWIVLSGFIGRIDDRNKRRLGKEIEDIIKIEDIGMD
jgi:uracil-DNA glycosylase